MTLTVSAKNQLILETIENSVWLSPTYRNTSGEEETGTFELHLSSTSLKTLSVISTVSKTAALYNIFTVPLKTTEYENKSERAEKYKIV